MDRAFVFGNGSNVTFIGQTHLKKCNLKNSGEKYGIDY
jgi:hypothetical protein